MKKIGIMGGTFNPIHNGHLLLAQTAYCDYGLDEVLFMPNKNPTYKDATLLASNEARVEMIKRAILNNPAFQLSTLELEREGNTYTVDTLDILTNRNPDTQYYFIMGADSLFYFDAWRQPEEILKKAILLVANRNQMSESALKGQIEYLKNQYENVSIELLEAPAFAVSSYDIRERIKDERNVQYMTPDLVIAYMKKHGLYRKEYNDEPSTDA